MDLFEYQAKDLFAKHEVPVTPGAVAFTAADARAAAEHYGGTVVVKAQVKTGGRGKAGGVKLADSPADAESTANDILGLDIKGHVVRRLARHTGGRHRVRVLRVVPAGPRQPHATSPWPASKAAWTSKRSRAPSLRRSRRYPWTR